MLGDYRIFIVFCLPVSVILADHAGNVANFTEKFREEATSPDSSVMSKFPGALYDYVQSTFMEARSAATAFKVYFTLPRMIIPNGNDTVEVKSERLEILGYLINAFKAASADDFLCIPIGSKDCGAVPHGKLKVVFPLANTFKAFARLYERLKKVVDKDEELVRFDIVSDHREICKAVDNETLLETLRKVTGPDCIGEIDDDGSDQAACLPFFSARYISLNSITYEYPGELRRSVEKYTFFAMSAQAICGRFVQGSPTGLHRERALRAVIGISCGFSSVYWVFCSGRPRWDHSDELMPRTTEAMSTPDPLWVDVRSYPHTPSTGQMKTATIEHSTTETLNMLPTSRAETPFASSLALNWTAMVKNYVDLIEGDIKSSVNNLERLSAGQYVRAYFASASAAVHAFYVSLDVPWRYPCFTTSPTTTLIVPQLSSSLAKVARSLRNDRIAEDVTGTLSRTADAFFAIRETCGGLRVEDLLKVVKNLVGPGCERESMTTGRTEQALQMEFEKYATEKGLPGGVNNRCLHLFIAHFTNNADAVNKIKRTMREFVRILVNVGTLCINFLNNGNVFDEDWKSTIEIVGAIRESFKALNEEKVPNDATWICPPPCAHDDSWTAEAIETVKQLIIAKADSSKDWTERADMHREVAEGIVAQLQEKAGCAGYQFSALVYLPYRYGAEDKHFAIIHASKEHLALKGSHGDVNYLVTFYKNDSSANEKWTTISARGAEIFQEVFSSASNNLSDSLQRSSLKSESNFAGITVVRCAYRFVWYELAYQYFHAGFIVNGHELKNVESGKYALSSNCGQIFFLP